MLAAVSLALTSGTADAMVVEDSTTEVAGMCAPVIGDAGSSLGESTQNDPASRHWTCICQIEYVRVNALGQLEVYCAWSLCTVIVIP